MAQRKKKQSNDLLELIIRKSFSAGEAWALTYHLWFLPEKRDTERKIRAAIKAARKILSSNNLTDEACKTAEYRKRTK